MNEHTEIEIKDRWFENRAGQIVLCMDHDGQVYSVRLPQLQELFEAELRSYPHGMSTIVTGQNYRLYQGE